MHPISGVSSLCLVPTRSPDLPSNGSSLRDLNCTHSNYQTCKGPVLLFFVTTSLCQDWVICAPAAFLGCGSNLSVVQGYVV